MTSDSKFPDSSEEKIHSDDHCTTTTSKVVSDLTFNFSPIDFSSINNNNSSSTINKTVQFSSFSIPPFPEMKENPPPFPEMKESLSTFQLPTFNPFLTENITSIEKHKEEQNILSKISSFIPIINSTDEYDSSSEVESLSEIEEESSEEKSNDSDSDSDSDSEESETESSHQTTVSMDEFYSEIERSETVPQFDFSGPTTLVRSPSMNFSEIFPTFPISSFTESTSSFPSSSSTEIPKTLPTFSSAQTMYFPSPQSNLPPIYEFNDALIQSKVDDIFSMVKLTSPSSSSSEDEEEEDQDDDEEDDEENSDEIESLSSDEIVSQFFQLGLAPLSLYSNSFNQHMLSTNTIPIMSPVQHFKDDKIRVEQNIEALNNLITSNEIDYIKFTLRKRKCKFYYETPSKGPFNINNEFKDSFWKFPSYLFVERLKHTLEWKICCVCEKKDNTYLFPRYFLLRTPYNGPGKSYYYLSFFGLHQANFHIDKMRFIVDPNKIFEIVDIENLATLHDFQVELHFQLSFELQTISKFTLKPLVKHIINTLRKKGVICKYKHESD
jgi:hypothetical protein